MLERLLAHIQKKTGNDTEELIVSTLLSIFFRSVGQKKEVTEAIDRLQKKRGSQIFFSPRMMWYQHATMSNTWYK